MKLPLIHPMVIHFPIAFYFLEALLLILWRWKEQGEYERFARFAFRMGYFFMIVAALAGLLDAGGFDGIQGKVRPHFFASLSVLVFYTLRAGYWHFAKRESLSYAKWQLIGALAGYALVVLTAFFGGEIVYG